MRDLWFGDDRARVQCVGKRIGDSCLSNIGVSGHCSLVYARVAGRKEPNDVVMCTTNVGNSWEEERAERRSSWDWLSSSTYAGITIIDPDGWNRRDLDDSMREPITEKEFRRRIMYSTIQYDQEAIDTIYALRGVTAWPKDREDAPVDQNKAPESDDLPEKVSQTLDRATDALRAMNRADRADEIAQGPDEPRFSYRGPK